MDDSGTAGARCLAPRPGLFVPVRRDPAGRVGPTDTSVRGPLWRRSSHGLWVPVSVEPTTDQSIVEAAAVLPEHGGVTGWAGLAWMGARWFDGSGPGSGRRPVPLVTAGDDIRPQPGIAVSAERLDPRDLLVLDQVRLTTAVRSAWFEARYAETLPDAVVVIDMACYDDLVSIDELADWSHEHPAWTGAPRFRSALALARENAWSPREVHLRLVGELLADMPRLLCNQPIFDRATGRLLGTPDLLDVEAGLAIEYDGQDHLKVVQRSRDVRREELFRGHELEVMTVLGPDLRDRADLADRMVAARARSRFQAESARTWTIDPPVWWTPTHTVALRRSLTEAQRQRSLRYRRAA